MNVSPDLIMILISLIGLIGQCSPGSSAHTGQTLHTNVGLGSVSTGDQGQESQVIEHPGRIILRVEEDTGHCNVLVRFTLTRAAGVPLSQPSIIIIIIIIIITIIYLTVRDPGALPATQ